MPKKGAAIEDSNAFEFQVNEIVLAYFGKMLYEAKVLKREMRDGVSQYFVHYQKWASKYDEWLEPERMLKKDDTSVKQMQVLNAKQKAIAAKAASGKATKKRSSKSIESSESEDDDASSESSDDGEDEDEDGSNSDDEAPQSRGRGRAKGGKKRKVIAKNDEDDDDDKPESSDDEFARQAHLIIPPSLQKYLLIDFENVKQNQKLVGSLPKPADRTVAAILDEWKTRAAAGAAGANKKDSPALAVTVAEGLRAYFDRLLPVCLLYDNERTQWSQLQQQQQQAHSDRAPPSQLLGAEHLLRLFAKLPELLTQTDIQGTELKTLMRKISEFLKFLNSQSSRYLSDAYISDPISHSNIVAQYAGSIHTVFVE